MKTRPLFAALAMKLFAMVPGFALADATQPVVVELFTSQSCYSCPPAEAFLGELAQEPGMVALEFHVDYWDTLVYGAAGAWKDPFSNPAYTQRQRRYNQAISGAPRAYTPQMVVDGKLEAVGSRRGAVRKAIARAKDQAKPLNVTAALGSGGAVAVSINPAGNRTGHAAPRGSVWLVEYIEKRITDVPRGENKGKTLVNHNIVTNMRRIAALEGAALNTKAALENANAAGCAILVQPEPEGPMLGAALCGAPES